MIKQFVNSCRSGVVIATSVTICGCSVPTLKGHTRGTVQASKDIASGDTRLLMYGTPSDWEGAYHQSLKEDLGVDVEYLAFCMVDENTAEYADAYNAKMRAEIESRHGTGILERVKDRAKSRYAQDPVNASELHDYSGATIKLPRSDNVKTNG